MRLSRAVPQGWGLATARRLLAAGASVALVDLPTSNGAAVAQSFGQSLNDRADSGLPTNGRVRFAPADVTDTDTDAVAAAIAIASQLAPIPRPAGTAPEPAR